MKFRIDNMEEEANLISEVIYSFVESRTLREVDKAIADNLLFMMTHPFLFTYADRARNRITRLAQINKELRIKKLN